MKKGSAVMRDDAAPGVLTRPETEMPPERPLPPAVRRSALPAPRPARRTYRRLVLAGVAAAALIVGLVLAWMPEPVSVDLGVVKRGPLEVTVDEDGRTRVKDRYVVSAPLGGTLARTALRAGDPVRRGDVVARVVPAASPLLDSRARAEAEARVSAARAALRRAGTEVTRARAARDFARREAERHRSLLEAGAAAPQAAEQAELAERMRSEDLASAEFGRRVAASEVDLARAALLRLDAPRAGDGFEVRSPIDGRVLRVVQESEAVVQSGTPLMEIGDPRALEVVADVLTADAVEIRPGAAARIERWGGEAALRGHVHRVEPSAFTRVSALGVEEQRVNVILDLDDEPARWATVGDGYRVEARIVVWQADGVLQVPAGAVFRHDGAWAVYAVEDGRARLRPVGIGRRNAARAQVTEGLREGEAVVVYPSDTMDDGVRVEGR
jgi:HlyD family secretion protein